MNEATRQLRLRVFLTYQRHAVGSNGVLDNNQLLRATAEIQAFHHSLADNLQRAVSVWQHERVDLDRVMQVVDEWITALEARGESG